LVVGGYKKNLLSRNTKFGMKYIYFFLTEWGIYPPYPPWKRACIDICNMEFDISHHNQINCRRGSSTNLSYFLRIVLTYFMEIVNIQRKVNQ